jgi:hypothetical protein
MVRELAHSSKISRSGEIKEKVYKSFEEIEKERELKATSQNLEYDATSDQGEIKVKDTKIVVLGKVENFEIIYDLYEIETKIKYFQEIHNQIKDPTKMTKQDRKKLVKRLREYTSNLYEIESFVRKGNNLLKEENISKLEHVFKEKSAKDKIKKWAKRLKETA